jgi:hypothetical protein
MQPTRNRYVMALMALPIPLPFALGARAVVGVDVSLGRFMAWVVVGIILVLLFMRAAGLDPPKYMNPGDMPGWRRKYFWQDWQEGYEWVDPFRIRRSAAAVLTALSLCILALAIEHESFITAIMGGGLGAAAYEAVRVFNNVYTARPVA